jgi:hypothetical protein
MSACAVIHDHDMATTNIGNDPCLVVVTGGLRLPECRLVSLFPSSRT